MYLQGDLLRGGGVPSRPALPIFPPDLDLQQKGKDCNILGMEN